MANKQAKPEEIVTKLRLRAVLLHRPGDELAASTDDPDAVQMLAPVDAGKAGAEHDAMAQALVDNGVVVHYVEPEGTPRPNQMFCADLLFMTPEGKSQDNYTGSFIIVTVYHFTSILFQTYLSFY